MAKGICYLTFAIAKHEPRHLGSYNRKTVCQAGFEKFVCPNSSALFRDRLEHCDGRDRFAAESLGQIAEGQIGHRRDDQG
jgi:hypothetical protein